MPGTGTLNCNMKGLGDDSVKKNKFYPLGGTTVFLVDQWAKHYVEKNLKMGEKKQIGYIDNSDIIEDEYYEEDGIHFKANFYPIWAEKMAEVATL